MIKHANKILYIGTGCHITPVTHFPETKQFVFIDTQPRSEYDSSNKNFYKKFYKEHFLNDLIASCQYYGFILDSFTVLDKKYYKNIISKKWYFSSWFYKIPADINPTLLIFSNRKTKQSIRYYISTNIKFNMNPILRDDIATCDGFIVSDYFAELKILDYFVTPMVFFGYTNTSYNITKSFDSDINNTILFFLHNCICNRNYYFIEFYIVYDDSGVILKCEDFDNFLSNMNDYHNFIKQCNDNINTSSTEYKLYCN